MHVLRGSRRARRWADLGLVITAAAWGSSFFLTKRSLDQIDAMALVGYRFLGAALVLAVAMPFLQRRGLAAPGPLFRGSWDGFRLGLVLWVLLATQTLGLVVTRASNSGFITGTSVVWVPVMAFFYHRHRPSASIIIPVLFSIGGLLLVTGGISGFNRGDALTLVCALAAALHILMVDAFSPHHSDPWKLALQQFTVVGVASLLVAVVLHRSLAVPDRATLLTIAYLALIPTLLAYGLQLFCQRIASSGRTALIHALEAPLAAAIAGYLGAESFRWARAAGGGQMLVDVNL
jgi:drug/metabolite transporter (DMT)-like permease